MLESLISLFNHTLIRSNRGTSYTWHFVRLQEKKKGACISLSRGGGERIRLRQRRRNQTEQQDVRVGRMGMGASQASFSHKAQLSSGKPRLDTCTRCTLVWHYGENILVLFQFIICFFATWLLLPFILIFPCTLKTLELNYRQSTYLLIPTSFHIALCGW